MKSNPKSKKFQKISAYSNRCAFLLNANAKRVTARTIAKLSQIVPFEDLFYSKTQHESEHYIRTILKRGYGKIFSGGGDGTLINVINTVEKVAKKEGHEVPPIGVLKLGTGNAMACLLNSSSIAKDTNHIIANKPLKINKIDMVESDDGVKTPFAGIGYDAEILNDYVRFKNKITHPIFSKIMHSVIGYVIIGFCITLPRILFKKRNSIKITTKGKAVKIVQQGGKDVQIPIIPGTVLYDAKAAMVSLGSIPYYGGGLKIFPFAGSKPGYTHLRIITGKKMLLLLPNLYPKFWKGTYRNPEIKDYLIKEIHIESSGDMPYQVGGDACGMRKSLTLKTAREQTAMLECEKPAAAKIKLIK